MDINSVIESATLDSIRKGFRLFNLLQVKGPDIEGFFWVNKEGQEIDCNIYHPKYGYRGYIADKLPPGRPVIWQGTRYEDPQTGRDVVCINYLEVLCLHSCGKFTNKDGVEILKKLFSSPTTRTAQTVDDLKQIFEREFIKTGLKGTHKSEALFARHLIEETDRCIELHKVVFPEPLKQDIALLLIAEEFKEWLLTIEHGERLASTNTEFSSKKNNYIITSIDQLFYKPDFIEPAIQILKKIDPPLISEKNMFLGKHKTALKIWMDALAYKNIVKPLPNDADLAQLLVAKFTQLSISRDGSTFRKQSDRAEQLYKKQIQVLVSQLSQNG